MGTLVWVVCTGVGIVALAVFGILALNAYGNHRANIRARAIRVAAARHRADLAVRQWTSDEVDLIMMTAPPKEPPPPSA
jgi:hypothetical protein